MNKAERTKKLIIEKSAPIINKKGIAGTSMNDIMEATALTKGGIYGNFESKDEICTEAFFFLLNNLSGTLDQAAARGKNTRTKFFNLLDAYLGKINEGGCPILNFGAEADDTHPQMRTLVKNAILSAQKKISNIISEGVKSGELIPDINPEVFSIKVFAVLEGGILCARVLENNEQLKIVITALKKEFDTYHIK